MANRQYMQAQTIDRARSAEVDAGLQAHMTKVYALMSGAMVITGLVAYIVGMDFRAAVNGEPTTLMPVALLQTMFSSPVKYIIMFAPLIFVFAFGAMINRVSASTAQMMLWGFGALMGLSISWIFAVFTGMSIATTFFVTAIAFGGLSLYGYTTKKDLSGWGSFLMMGVIGLIVASLVNLFLESSALHWAISAIGVLLFAGLTAFNTQQIKVEYLQVRTQPGGAEIADKMAVMGALSLYINFINMFMFLLQFMGSQE